MVTFETIKAKLEALLSSANQTTGEEKANLTDAVERLREGFSQGKIHGMTNPAGDLDVLYGKEYIIEDGTLHTGAIPERSENDVTMTDGGDFVQADILAGYYPKNVIKRLSYTAGNAFIIPTQTVLSKGSELFGDNNAGIGAEVFTRWRNFLRSWFGVDLYYLPMTIGVMVGGSQVPIEGAFIATSFNAETGAYSAAYNGRSVIGGYSLAMMINGSSGHDTVTDISLKDNGGESVDISSGLMAVPIITTFA